jgi:hypothetical protein
MKPKYYYSQASFSQQYFLETMKRDYQLPPKRVMQFALNAYNGGRFEVFKRGTYDGISAYDIRSAYPFQNVKIPSLDNGTWKESQRYDEDATISLFHVIAKGDSHISPMKAESKGMIYYPTGKRELYINKKEYETLKLYNYDVKILKAYHYYPKEKEYPFTFLSKFYDKKEKVGKKHPDYMFYKIIINGFYGKTIQLEPKNMITDEDEGEAELIKGNPVVKTERFNAGLLFNPVVAQEITGNTRSMLLDAVVDMQEDVIAFATDSIISTKKPNIKIGKSLGDWDEEKSNRRFTSIGSGVYFFEDDMMKFRGFGRGYNPEVIQSDTEKVMLDVKRNIKLKQTFKSKEKDLDRFNLILDMQKSFNLNFDRKRLWLDQFNNSDEIYNKQIESKPIRVTT